MRASVLFSGLAVVLALSGCKSTTPDGASQTGGITSGGGQDQSGAGGGGSGGSAGSGGTSSGGTTTAGSSTGSGGTTTSSGGIIGKGGATSNGGSSASGGATLTGGIVGSGGQQAGGGATARGGATASGGATSSGGTTGSGGGPGPDAALPSYQGPCDVLASGCAEAYSVARAMTASYTGPLFALGKASDAKAATLDVGQTSDHKADMTTWSAYCGGTQSNCVVSKLYAQIHKGSNDLLPGVWNTPWKPDCSAGGYTCAAKFTIESATGLPILTTVSPQEYALSGDAFATGINGGSKAMGIMYNGKPVANATYCCGVIGLTHKYNATDTTGTDFMLALAYGWRDSGGCCIATNCGASNKYCVGAEEEENNDMYDYGTSPVDNAMVVTQYDPTANAVIVYLNGTLGLTKSPPKAGKLNAGTAIHLGGGGDLSQPDPVLMRESLFTNNVMSASEVKAMMANIQAAFTSLKFP
jgi:hypothetical protein